MELRTANVRKSVDLQEQTQEQRLDAYIRLGETRQDRGRAWLVQLRMYFGGPKVN